MLFSFLFLSVIYLLPTVDPQLPVSTNERMYGLDACRECHKLRIRTLKRYTRAGLTECGQQNARATAARENTGPNTKDTHLVPGYKNPCPLRELNMKPDFYRPRHSDVNDNNNNHHHNNNNVLFNLAELRS